MSEDQAFERQQHRDRHYDIVLFGATGFTGGLTAEYLARHAPEGCRWALAGRNRTRLEQVRERLAAIDSRLGALPLLRADVEDAASLRTVAESARVVATTVGPYLEHGEPLVGACAAAGTDYLDLTGEPEFVDRMFVAYDGRARSTGARLVHCAGFDAVPHDLGALFTVRRLPDDVPIRVRGTVRSNGTFSGGTFASALTQLSRARHLPSVAAERRRLESRPGDRRARAARGVPHRDADSGLWLVPLPTIDPVVVARSARALPEYGPDFTYSHYAGLRTLRMAVAGVGGAAALFAAAQVPPLRGLLRARVPQGRGPSAAKRARSWFTVDFLGEGGGRRVHTRVEGGDPGYEETSKMLAESALCLALDRNPETAGQVTTAVAMGDRLIERLTRAGIEFRVLSVEEH